MLLRKEREAEIDLCTGRPGLVLASESRVPPEQKRAGAGGNTPNQTCTGL